jgi:hypothetical protein
MAADDMAPADMIAMYIKLRDHIKQAQDEFEKSLERPKAGMKKLESMLLDHLNTNKLDNLAAKGIGTAYRNTSHSATVEDREAFKAFMESNDAWALADIRANKKTCREAVEKGVEVPGVKLTSVVTVGVRRKGDKE